MQELLPAHRPKVSQDQCQQGGERDPDCPASYHVEGGDWWAAPGLPKVNASGGPQSPCQSPHRQALIADQAQGSYPCMIFMYWASSVIINGKDKTISELTLTHEQFQKCDVQQLCNHCYECIYIPNPHITKPVLHSRLCSGTRVSEVNKKLPKTLQNFQYIQKTDEKVKQLLNSG